MQVDYTACSAALCEDVLEMGMRGTLVFDRPLPRCAFNGGGKVMEDSTSLWCYQCFGASAVLTHALELR